MISMITMGKEHKWENELKGNERDMHEKARRILGAGRGMYCLHDKKKEAKECQQMNDLPCVNTNITTKQV